MALLLDFVADATVEGPASARAGAVSSSRRARRVSGSCSRLCRSRLRSYDHKSALMRRASTGSSGKMTRSRISRTPMFPLSQSEVSADKLLPSFFGHRCSRVAHLPCMLAVGTEQPAKAVMLPCNDDVSLVTARTRGQSTTGIFSHHLTLHRFGADDRMAELASGGGGHAKLHALP